MGELKIDVEIAGLNREQTCEGQGFSPQVSIGGLRSSHLSLVMEDADRPGDVYWALWNVPRRDTIPRRLPQQAKLTEPIEGVQGKNLRGDHGYAAPCPAPNEEGHYVLRVYGLDGVLDLDPNTATRDEAIEAMNGLAREYGESHMVYSRKREWTSSYEY